MAYRQERESDAMSRAHRQETRMVGQPVMYPGPLPSKSDKADNACNQLATRIIGTISLFVGLLLFMVSCIIISSPCCGDNWKYDSDEWEEECQTEGSDDEFFAGNSGTHSCYHRNISAIVTGIFSLLLLGVGTTVLIVGECMYDVNEEDEEEKLANMARYMKAKELELQRIEREDRRYEREERREQRRIDKASDRSMIDSSDVERSHRINNMRRYSVGSPQTPSDRQLYAYQRDERPQVVQSHPYVYGNSRPYQVV